MEYICNESLDNIADAVFVISESTKMLNETMNKLVDIIKDLTSTISHDRTMDMEDYEFDK